MSTIMRMGRDLFDLNANTLRCVIEQHAESFRKLTEVNQSFFSRLPEARDLPSLVSLLQECGETVWNGAQRALRARGLAIKRRPSQRAAAHAFAPDAGLPARPVSAAPPAR